MEVDREYEMNRGPGPVQTVRKEINPVRYVMLLDLCISAGDNHKNIR